MSARSMLTFGVELEFLLPYLSPEAQDPTEGTREQRPVARVGANQPIFDTIVVDILGVFEEKNIPIQKKTDATTHSRPDGHTENVQVPNYWSISPALSVTERCNAFGYSWVGVELQSPVVPVSQAGFVYVANIVDLLRSRFRIRVNQDTGFHVHIGMRAQPLPPRVIHRLTQLLWCADGMLSRLHPPERALRTNSASIRQVSHLAQGNTDSWHSVKSDWMTTWLGQGKPPMRATRRGSLDESLIIQERLKTVHELSSTRTLVESMQNLQLAHREQEDKERFVMFRAACHGCSVDEALELFDNLEQIQESLFGNWSFQEPFSVDTQNTWIVDTETLVSNTWEEINSQAFNLPNQYLGSRENEVQFNSPASGVSGAEFYDADHELTTEEPETYHDNNNNNYNDYLKREVVHLPDLPTCRLNPYRDHGAHVRHIDIHGYEMPNWTERQWLGQLDLHAPITVVEGLRQLTNPEIHADTRRAAHFLTSVLGRRCNYNFSSYALHNGPETPTMTVEFREACGSMSPIWISAWTRICAGIVEFCLLAERDAYVEVIMRLVEAQVADESAERASNNAETSRASFPMPGLLNLLTALGLRQEAKFVSIMLRENQDRFWFPCPLVRKSLDYGEEDLFIEPGLACLPPDAY